jgi:hypothetical protein
LQAWEEVADGLGEELGEGERFVFVGPIAPLVAALLEEARSALPLCRGSLCATA